TARRARTDARRISATARQPERRRARSVLAPEHRASAAASHHQADRRRSQERGLPTRFAARPPRAERARTARVVKQVPYAAIRLVGGVLAALWCIYVFWREGSVGTVFLGMALFAAGWLAAQRFGLPVGLTNKPPWLDTVLPVAIAAFAVLPAALHPFTGTASPAAAASTSLPLVSGL